LRVLIAGGGEVVFFLAKSFLSKGYQVSVINRNAKECEQLARSLKALVINGDSSDPRILEDARAREADMLAAVTPYDHVNLASCLSGKVLFDIRRTLTLINDPDNFEIYKQLGVDHVFNQTDLIVSMLERNLEYKHVNTLFSYADGKFLLNEIVVTEKMPVSKTKVEEFSLPENTQIVSVVRDGDLYFAKEGFEFQPGDRILLMTTPQSHSSALRLLCEEEA